MSTKKFLKDSFLVTFMGLISKFLGCIRDSLLVNFLGTGALSDSFNLAVKLPNSFRKSISDGSINNVLLPKLKELEKAGEKRRIYALIFNVFGVFSALLFLFYFSEQYFQSCILSYLAPGFNGDQITYYVNFIRITSISALTYFCYSLCSSLLQFKRYFFWPVFAISILNGSVIISILLSMYFKINIEYIVYFYFFSTMLMMCATVIPSVVYSFFDETLSSKIYLASFIIIFLVAFLLLPRTFKFILVIFVYSLFFYFGNKFNFFSSDCIFDLSSFFLFFFPVFFVGICSQCNEIISMSFGSLFPAGSMTIIIRSGKVMQLPISLIIPLFVTLLSHLTNLSDDKDHQLYLKRMCLLFVFFVTVLFCLICFFFAEFLIKLTFLFKISYDNVIKMSPIVKLYSLAMPAVLMTRMFQMFFFIEKTVFFPAIIAFLNSFFYIVFINLFFYFNFSLSSIIIPFILCSWITFFIYLFVGNNRGLI